MTNVERFAALFQGSDRAHTTARMPKNPAAGKKVKPVYITAPGPAELSHYAAHLAGDAGLVVIPIRGDMLCLFGGIDADVYDLDLPALEAKCRALKLPLIVCRSKSGGAHLYLLLRNAAAAARVRALLAKWAAALGFASSEIFPKQVVLNSTEDVGNGINIPYYDNEGPTSRYCQYEGKALLLEEFLDYAEGMRTTIEAAEAITLQNDDVLPDGPPCLQAMIARGVGEGERNKFLFNLGIYARLLFDDDWPEKLEEYNLALLAKPLKAKELQALTKSLEKKEYFYTCNDVPFCDVCKHSMCKGRKYDIGGDDPLPAATKRNFRFIAAGDLEARAPEWLIHGVVEIDSLALLFGDPAAGKSFVALDLACSIATGTAWHDHNVRQGPVCIIAGEGHNGLTRRLAAWCIRHRVNKQDLPVFVSNTAAALCLAVEFADVEAAIDEIAATHGTPQMIVVDTLARNFGPADENSTQDMNAFIAAADALRGKYHCTVLLVHHTGHADKTRARGAMALKGALDAEYKIIKDGNVIQLECTKAKDAQPPDAMAFQLRTVELGITGDDGQPVTSAVLDATDFVPVEEKPVRQGKWQSLALTVLRQLEGESGRNISVGEWRDACVAKGMPVRRFHAVRKKLTDGQFVKIDQGVVISPF